MKFFIPHHFQWGTSSKVLSVRPLQVVFMRYPFLSYIGPGQGHLCPSCYKELPVLSVVLCIQSGFFPVLNG